jgi:hypothetical protein
MKKIIYSFIAICTMVCYSCAFDNFDEPSARFYGRIIDRTTGENFVMSSNSLQVRMWEISYSETPSPRNLNIKDDGTFNNDKLFAGTYKVLPTNGAFWPLQDTAVIELKDGGATEHNFTVTPYLGVSIVDYHLDGDNILHISGSITAPVREGLPRVLDIRPLVAITRYVGSANITAYSDPARVVIEKNISDIADGQIFNMEVKTDKGEGLLSGRRFYVRLGARVDDSYRAYNYSDIIEIDVP